jgi:hypothetical protein
MATVAQVAKASLQRILVQASEAELQPDEYQDFIFAMNNYMLDLDASGITLGYTEVSNLADQITIPTGALRGLIANMAIEVAPDYGGEITQGLQIAAQEGLKTMRKLGIEIKRSNYPSTLPIGSGNEHCGTWRTSHFYPEQEDLILAETTGSIALESGTNEAANNG